MFPNQHTWGHLFQCKQAQSILGFHKLMYQFAVAGLPIDYRSTDSIENTLQTLMIVSNCLYSVCYQENIRASLIALDQAKLKSWECGYRVRAMIV